VAETDRFLTARKGAKLKDEETAEALPELPPT
jgi:hypothetical protein